MSIQDDKFNLVNEYILLLLLGYIQVVLIYMFK